MEVPGGVSRTAPLLHEAERMHLPRDCLRMDAAPEWMLCDSLYAPGFQLKLRSTFLNSGF